MAKKPPQKIGNPERFEHLRSDPRKRVELLKALRRRDRLGLLTRQQSRDLDDLQLFHNQVRLEAVAGNPKQLRQLKEHLTKFEPKLRPSSTQRPAISKWVSFVNGGLPGKR